MDPATLKYAKTHEWVHVDGDTATIGITDFAVRALTDLVYIDLPAVGKSIQAGETFGVVESVKAVSDLYAPVSGEILEANDTLGDNLDLLSDDAFGKGWMLKVKLADSSALDTLMTRSDYEAHCAAESH